MSEPDDKPDTEAGKASPSKSLFDSNWALLGPSASGSGSSPIFAPPKPAGTEAPKPMKPAGEAEPASVTPVTASRSDKLPAANSAPRTSAVAASVSGEFLAPEPRPEPKTPPRYEPPEGVTPDYANADDETADSLPILPPPGSDHGSDTEDDESGKVIEFGQARGAKKPNAPVEYEKPRARPPESFEIEGEPSEAEPERGSVGKLVVIVGVLAAVGLIALFVSKSRDGQRDSPTASASTGEEPGPSTKQPRARPEVGPKRGTSESGSDEVDMGSDETGSDEIGAGETGEQPKPPKPKPSNVDPRDPSLIPPGTPEENAKAFTKLPVSIHDGPPIGGIGRTGIHIDEVSTSRGRDNTDCDQPTEQFSMGVAKYVNVCFRVVHPREQESLRVIWEKDGKVTRRGRVRIPDVHAYTTRAYLLLRPEYVGNWRVRIVPEGEEVIDLAVAEFVITE